MEEEFKTVASFTDSFSASVVAGLLMDNGIPAGVFGVNSSYISLNYVDPIAVKVNASDYDAAMEILSRNAEGNLNEIAEDSDQD